MNAIEIASLTKIYERRGSDPVNAVVDLSLSIAAGQIFGFLGPNGAGKTTTIKMICGLVIPTSGTALLNGHDPLKDRSDAMRQIGVVLEGTRNVYWRLTAWQNLMYFGRLKAMASRDVKARAEWLLTELDLWDRRDDEVREFSRGMQQKVAIAAALIADPPIVLLDEPTLGLDVQSARTVREWIERLARDEGKTVLLTTHQLSMAQDLCDHVAIINEGRLVANEPIDGLLALFKQDSYLVRVRGNFDSDDPRLAGLRIEEAEGETVISGEIVEQQRLQEVLGVVGDLGLTILSVERSEPDLEEVFVRLIGEEGRDQ